MFLKDCKGDVKVLLIHTLSQLRLKIHLCGQEFYLPNRKLKSLLFLSFFLSVCTSFEYCFHYWFGSWIQIVNKKNAIFVPKYRQHCWFSVGYRQLHLLCTDLSLGNFHYIDLRFDSWTNNESGVSSIVMIFERNNSAILSKMDKLFWHHFKRWACISAVKSFGTKREQSFLISNEDK